MPLCGTWSLISRTLIDQGKAVIKFNYRIFKRAVQRNKAFYCVRMPCDAFLQNAAEEFLNLQKAHFRRISQATTWYCYSWRFVVQLHWSIRLVNSMRTAWHGIEKQLKTFHISSFLSLAIHRFFSGKFNFPFIISYSRNCKIGLLATDITILLKIILFGCKKAFCNKFVIYFLSWYINSHRNPWEKRTFRGNILIPECTSYNEPKPTFSSFL